MAWRKADNWTAFTDGYRTWINGPNGLVMRLNTERFVWEADYEAITNPQPIATPPRPTPRPTSPLDGIVAHTEYPGYGYDRDEFGSWIDADRNNCNTRCEVLREEGFNGSWYSWFDGVIVTVSLNLDIDRLVPLKEAYESGAWAWGRAKKRAFANDLDLPESLTAVTVLSNRSKGSRDPAAWKPPLESAWCEYALDWIKVKNHWGLTYDQAEITALGTMLARCPRAALQSSFDSHRFSLLIKDSLSTGTMLAEKDWGALYLAYPQDYRAKCPISDFFNLWWFIEVITEMPDGLTFNLQRAWIDGHYGYTEWTLVKDGVEWEDGIEIEEWPSFVWIDGEWTAFVSREEWAMDNPCEI